MGGEGGGETVTHFVFVHGANHGAWCWYKIITLLESAGFKCTSVDLTGAGINLTDPNTVSDFDQYNQPLFSLLSDCPPHHRVILVGHSIGGGSVTEALCKFTDKISMVVYLAANMVQPGSAAPSPHNSSMFMEEGIWEYIYGEGDNEPPTGVIMKKEFQRRYYYSQSPLEEKCTFLCVIARTILEPLTNQNISFLFKKFGLFMTNSIVGPKYKTVMFLNGPILSNLLSNT